jgi:hypothetical protein
VIFHIIQKLSEIKAYTHGHNAITLFSSLLVYSFTCNLTTLCQLQHMLYNDLWKWKDWRRHHHSLFWVLLEQISISTKFCNQNSQQSSHDSNQYLPHIQLYQSAQSLALHRKFKNYFPPVSKTMKSTFIESNCHNEWKKQTTKQTQTFWLHVLIQFPSFLLHHLSKLSKSWWSSQTRK